MTDDEDDAELEERGMGLEDVFGGTGETESTVSSETSESLNASETTETSKTTEALETTETTQSLETLETQDEQEDPSNEGQEQTENTDESEGATDSGSSGQSKIARENKNVNMFLNKPTYRRLMRGYKQLDGEHYTQYETDLEKNRQYFDAVINTGLNHLDEVRDQIGLEQQ